MRITLVSGAPNAEKAIEEVFEKNGIEREAAPEPTEEEKAAAAEAEKQQREQAEREEEQKRPSRFQRRLERATSELRSENEELKARIAALEGKGGGAGEEEIVEENPRPKRDQFQTQEEYEDALMAWGTERAIAERDARNAEDAQRQQLETIYQGYREQVEAFKDAHDDWDDTVNQNLPMHTSVQLAIFEMPNAAEVTYYLGKNPKFTEKLAEMTPLAAVMEVARLSDKLKSGNRSSGPATAWGGEPRSTAVPRKPAPAPVQPVRTTAITPPTSKEAAANRDYKSFKRAQRAGR